MMNVGFTEEEYERVREWALSALVRSPDILSEASLLANLRADKWHMFTTEHAVAIFEFCRIDGELIANALVLAGAKGKALREIVAALSRLAAFLKHEGFSKIVGTPRKEFHRILKANGFEEQEQEELILRLN